METRQKSMEQKHTQQIPMCNILYLCFFLIKILIRIFTFFFHFNKFFILTISYDRVLCSIYVYLYLLIVSQLIVSS